MMSLSKHVNNIRIFRAYSALELLKQAALFPIDYYLRNGRSSYPLNMALFVTTRCNARCSMCNLRAILNEKEANEPAPADIDKFLSSIKGVKPSIILFGGEPFVRTDILDIVRLVKKRRFRCGIFTNGTLLNREVIKKLDGLRLDFIVFSIQGIGDVHDDVVGVKGAYASLLENMRLFIRSRNYTKVIMHTMIIEENLEDLANIARLGKENNVDLVRFGHPTFFTLSDLKRNKEVCNRLFPGEGISEMSYSYDPQNKGGSYYSAIQKLKEEFGSGIAFVPDLDLNEVRHWYSGDFKTKRKCLFLWRGLFIYPDGCVYPCESLRYPIGNIYKDDFKDIWNNARYTKLRAIIRRDLLPACARCCKL